MGALEFLLPTLLFHTLSNLSHYTDKCFWLWCHGASSFETSIIINFICPNSYIYIVNMAEHVLSFSNSALLPRQWEVLRETSAGERLPATEGPEAGWRCPVKSGPTEHMDISRIVKAKVQTVKKKKNTHTRSLRLHASSSWICVHGRKCIDTHEFLWM